jgi:hypothetical protein
MARLAPIVRDFISSLDPCALSAQVSDQEITTASFPVGRAAEAGSVSSQDNSSKTPAENRTVQVLKFYLYS